jgi:energy-coupling factor transport system permease protein
VEGLPGVLRPAAFTALPLWIFSFLIHGLFRHAPLAALGLATRFTTIIIAFYTLLAVVQPSRLVDALLVRGLPFSFAYVFSATLQSVPRLQSRAREFLDAQRCRGLAISGSPWRRARALFPVAIPLILAAVSEVDNQSLALEARGAGRVITRRTPLHPPADSAVERVIRWTLVTVTVGVIVWRIAT